MSMRDRLREGLGLLPPRLRRQVLHGLGRYAPWEVGFDFTPPPLRPGEEVGPPSFVGIGAQKAGTTWWYELMLTHPGISSRDDIHKERHFFDRFGARSMGPSDIDQYHGWFPRSTGTATGEWTPDYLTFPWVPGLLRRAAPDARLLLLLRDPVERFRSGLDHLDRMGAPPDGTAIADAVQRGFYFRALEGWLDQFEPGQLLVLQHERCVADRDGQLEATFRHLGLPPHRPPASDQPARAPAGPRRALDDDVRRYLTALYAPDVIALAENHSGLDLALWPNFAYLTGSTDPPAPGPNSPTRRP
ncbi:MAG: sulfotransferase [Acidimicrobiales bacterium]